MQFLGNLFSHCMQKKTNQLTILGATSGDTGSAAINAFKGKKNINVFILHPHNKVSEVQRKQMTTNLDENPCTVDQNRPCRLPIRPPARLPVVRPPIRPSSRTWPR